MLTSLFISALAGKLNRKTLLLELTLAMDIFGAIVAVAPNYFICMLRRALIGIVVGGFWSMSAATAIRLVPAHDVLRALAVVNGGNALAMVFAAPLPLSGHGRWLARRFPLLGAFIADRTGLAVEDAAVNAFLRTHHRPRQCVQPPIPRHG